MKELSQNELNELRPFVEEAVEALGFIRPEAMFWFMEAFGVHWMGNAGLGVCKTGTLIPREQRESMGLAPDACLTYEAHHSNLQTLVITGLL